MGQAGTCFGSLELRDLMDNIFANSRSFVIQFETHRYVQSLLNDACRMVPACYLTCWKHRVSGIWPEVGEQVFTSKLE
jgi:hypothetical protein